MKKASPMAGNIVHLLFRFENIKCAFSPGQVHFEDR